MILPRYFKSLQTKVIVWIPIVLYLTSERYVLSRWVAVWTNSYINWSRSGRLQQWKFENFSQSRYTLLRNTKNLPKTCDILTKRRNFADSGYTHFHWQVNTNHYYKTKYSFASFCFDFKLWALPSGIQTESSGCRASTLARRLRLWPKRIRRSNCCSGCKTPMCSNHSR